MKLRYVDANGARVDYKLQEDVTRIGRVLESEVTLDGDKVSRHHAAIRYWDGDFIIKDLRSRNGTFVNSVAVDVAKLEPGDTIRIGGFELHFEQRSPKVPNTIIREISEEMSDGSGYGTIMRKLVEETKPEADTRQAPKKPDA